ncbi:MAG: ankyrin repeat domain-containing protein [Victivallales bacterium]|nr:ankyrin repeat domain-containing protein [Victivallales bacterium]
MSTIFSLAAFAAVFAQMEPEVVEMLVKGDLKNAISAAEDVVVKENLQRIQNVDRLFMSKLEGMTGSEISFMRDGVEEKGNLVKVEGGRLFIRVQKEEVGASVTYPVSVRALPIERKMEQINIPEEYRNLVLGVREFKARNYSAASAYFSRTGAHEGVLSDAADKHSNWMLSLWKACIDGDLKAVEGAVAKGADVNGRMSMKVLERQTGRVGKIETTPLIQAVKSKDLEIIRLLLRSGADVDAANSMGVAPVMIAIFDSKDDDLSVLELLLQSNADLQTRDKSGNTPLAGALAAKRNKAAEMLVKYGADVNSPRTDGATPVIVAVAMNNADGFLFLMDKGADMTRRHSGGWTVFDMDRSGLDPRIKAVLDRLSPPRKESQAPGLTLPGRGIQILPGRN